MNELISVIIPVYNMQSYLSDCLNSVINQTYNNLEIIIIDDGSTDGSSEICDEYAQNDKRVCVIHQSNSGLVNARKKGLEIASGKYVGFVDSDDWIDPEMYEYLYSKMLETKAQIVTSGRYVETGESKELADNIRPGLYHPQKDKYFLKHMIFGERKVIWGITPNFWNKLFLKDILVKWENLVDPAITYGEDDACVYPCMAFADSVFVSDRCFYHYRLRNSSMSNSSDDMYFTRINKLYLAMKNAFDMHPYSDILLGELGDYMFEFALRGINGLWGIKSSLSIPRHWLDASGLLGASKILLYGAGQAGRDLYNQLCFMGLKDTIIWTDRNAKELQKKGLDVVQLSEVDLNLVDKIIIAIANGKIAEEVRNDFLEKGIDDSKIYWKELRKILEQTAIK